MSSRPSLRLACICFAAGLVPAAHADMIVDVDAGTPGIQTSLSVLSGASVTIVTFYDPTISGPLAFNGFGIDLNWSGTATATPTTPGLAGTIAGAGLVLDLVSAGGPLGPGSPLAPAGVPAVPGPSSIGGVGMVDLTSGGFGFGGPIPIPVDLFGVTFTISGSPGDTVTFTPTGILAPGAGATAGVGPFVPAADSYQLGPGAPTATLTDIGLGGTITIIPEPGTIAYALLGLVALTGCWRRWSMAHG